MRKSGDHASRPQSCPDLPRAAGCRHPCTTPACSWSAFMALEAKYLRSKLKSNVEPQSCMHHTLSQIKILQFVECHRVSTVAVIEPLVGQPFWLERNEWHGNE
jgi:hypothetical protein